VFGIRRHKYENIITILLIEFVKHPVFFYLTQSSTASSLRKPASIGTSCDSCGGQDNKNKGTLCQCVLQEGHFVKTLVNFWF
jgi:hypothetical protein